MPNRVAAWSRVLVRDDRGDVDAAKDNVAWCAMALQKAQRQRLGVEEQAVIDGLLRGAIFRWRELAEARLRFR